MTRRQSQRSGGRKPSRSRSGGRKAGGRRTAAASKRGGKSATGFLTPARKREILGALLLALGVLTLVSFATERGSLTERWVDALTYLFGWGAYAAPVLMGGIGGWLIVDSMDDRVELSWPRPLGALGLFVALVSLLHMAAAGLYPEYDLTTLHTQRLGGGWLGYVLAGRLLLPGLGTVPSVAALLVLALLSTSFVAGYSLNQSAERSMTWLRKAAAAAWAGRREPLEWLRGGGRSLRRAGGVAPELPDESGFESVPLVDPGVDALLAKEGGPGQGAAAAGGGASKVIEASPARSPGLMPRPDWKLPDIDGLLAPAAVVEKEPGEAEKMAETIVRTLSEFGIPVEVVKINPGPTITQFGLKPGYVERNGQRTRVPVRRIISLQNDLSLALAASPVRILAPVPGRPYLGVEVPNASKAMVSLRGVMESEDFRKIARRGGLPVALGRDTSGQDSAGDLTRMPHLLIAGATGSGKSVCVNALISSLLLTHTPDTLKMVLVDPKRVEMSQYRGLPHLATPVIVEAERVVGVLQWAVREMDRRYRSFAKAKARNLQGYNRLMESQGQPILPYLVIIIDELADLMMLAPEETERLITRLAQLARATGIHLVLATQRPSVDVVTGLIKANFPSRIAFAVSSSTDSRVILDAAGADKLLGRGDMLYMSSDDSKLRRFQGCYVSDEEIDAIALYWKRHPMAARAAGDTGQMASLDAPRVGRSMADPGPAGAASAGGLDGDVPEDASDADARTIADAMESPDTRMTLGIPDPMIDAELWDQMVDPQKGALADKRDELWDQAVAVIREHEAASTSFLQRKLRIGYSRAARLIDELEEAGLIGPAQGNQPRELRIGSDEDVDAAADYRTRLKEVFDREPDPASEPPPRGVPLTPLELPLEASEEGDAPDAGGASSKRARSDDPAWYDLPGTEGDEGGEPGTDDAEASTPDSEGKPEQDPDDAQDESAIRPWIGD